MRINKLFLILIISKVIVNDKLSTWNKLLTIEKEKEIYQDFKPEKLYMNFENIIVKIIFIIIIFLCILFFQQYLISRKIHKTKTKDIKKIIENFKEITNNKEKELFTSYNDIKENIKFFNNPVYNTIEERNYSIIEKSKLKLEKIKKSIQEEKAKIEKLEKKNLEINNVLKGLKERKQLQTNLSIINEKEDKTDFKKEDIKNFQ